MPLLLLTLVSLFVLNPAPLNHFLAHHLLLLRGSLLLFLVLFVQMTLLLNPCWFPLLLRSQHLLQRPWFTTPMDPIHATTSVAPSASHPMITCAKSGIFKTRHPAHLNFVQSSPTIRALLATFEPKGFKSTPKNPAWLPDMDGEIKAL